MCVCVCVCVHASIRACVHVHVNCGHNGSQAALEQPRTTGLVLDVDRPGMCK